MHKLLTLVYTVVHNLFTEVIQHIQDTTQSIHSIGMKKSQETHDNRVRGIFGVTAELYQVRSADTIVNGDEIARISWDDINYLKDIDREGLVWFQVIEKQMKSVSDSQCTLKLLDLELNKISVKKFPEFAVFLVR